MHPSANFIRYALAESWGEATPISQLTMSKELLGYGLLQVDEDAFDAIRRSFCPPEDFKPKQRKHPETRKFMQDEKLVPLWDPDEDVKRVMSELLHQQLVAEKIRILILGDVPAKVIADKVSQKFRIGPPITEKMIQYYRHFFWNPSVWSAHTWKHALFALDNADALLAALTCGAQQALFRAGFNPKYDPKQALRDTHRQITFRIQAMGFWPDGKNTCSLLSMLCREERALYERLFGEGSGLIEQAREIRLFLMEHKTPNVKALEKFIEEHGGSYSRDGTEPKRLTDGEPDVELEPDEDDNEPETAA